MSAPAIEARGLTKVYDDRPVVDRLDLTVAPGEFFGFLGPNGAGKSTTIRMLTGTTRPSAGSARVAGHDVGQHPLEVKARIGVLPEEVQTYDRLTPRELLEFTGRLHGGERAAVRERAERLLDLVELAPPDRDRLLLDHSLGMRKKVALCGALIHAPPVLFLDEPFNGIDALTVRTLQHVLRTLVERGVTIFYTSHVLEVVERLCTRVGIVIDGRLVACGDLASLRDAAGLGADAPLGDVFARLVGQGDRGDDLSWLVP